MQSNTTRGTTLRRSHPAVQGRKISTFVQYLLITLLAFIMIFPLIWLVFATFKPSHEIFDHTRLLPREWKFDNYINGWRSVRPYSYTTFYLNTLKLVLPVVLGNVLSAAFVGYGFARGNFKGKNLLFSILIGTMMLPGTVTMIPNFVIFNSLGWVNTYLPFIVPAFLGGSTFFIFLMVQHIRSIPKDLDESAMIDGCNSFQRFSLIIMPMCIPTLITITIFSFLWAWDDFMGQLIYISQVDKFTITLALKLMIDPLSAVDWGGILAMSLVSLIPSLLLYFFAQDYFEEGISTTGLKG